MQKSPNLGPIERSARRRRRIGSVQKMMLLTVATLGSIALLTAAPGLPLALAKLVDKKRLRYFQADGAFQKIVAAGLVEFIERPGKKKRLQLSAQGYLALGNIKELAPAWYKRWDKRWRIVIFDIPEKRSHLRKTLRKMLIRMGFYMMQKSVWISPYDCEEILALIKVHLNAKTEILYMVVESLENDALYREYFGLKKA